jgi:hypothetical protein
MSHHLWTTQQLRSSDSYRTVTRTTSRTLLLQDNPQETRLVHTVDYMDTVGVLVAVSRSSCAVHTSAVLTALCWPQDFELQRWEHFLLLRGCTSWLSPSSWWTCRTPVFALAAMDSFKCLSVWQSTCGVSFPIQATSLQSIAIRQTIHVMHAREFFVCVHYHITADCKPYFSNHR